LKRLAIEVFLEVAPYAVFEPVTAILKDSPVNGTSAPVFRLMSDS